MSAQRPLTAALPPLEPIELDRRSFLRALGGLVLVVATPRFANGSEEVRKYGADAMPHGWRDDPLTFVAIGEDGIVSVIVHRSEMGQGVRSSLPLIVADELEADLGRVRVLQAPGDEEKYGNQNTDGSRSVRHWFEPMRRCGAAARTMLEAAAAAAWGVPVASVRAENHEVVHAESDRRISYGALAKAAAELPVPARESLRLKQPSQFRYIGKDTLRLLDGEDMVKGRALYGQDVRLEGMLYAVVARAPVMGGKVVRFDATQTLAIPGVAKVVEIPGTALPAVFHPLNGIAVLARDTWTAIKGRKALEIEWNDGEHGSYDSTAYRAELDQAASQPGKVLRNVGDVDAAFAKAKGERIVEASYYLPHIAHATMEPPSATARIVDGHCEVWACVQAPQDAREQVAQRLALPLEKVTIHVTLLGGGFGRKSKPDFVVEAALLSREMDGKPVKVVWTREDDIKHDYFHTVSVERLRAALDRKGRPAAWLHRSVAPSITSLFMPNASHQGAFESGMGHINLPFDIPNLRIENPEATAHTRIGWFRSVSNIPHAFAAQCFIAELATTAGRDHRDYLLDLIGPSRQIAPAELGDNWNYGESPQRYPVDAERLRRVIETATRQAGWGRKLPKGRGLGLAAHYSFVSYAAAVIEVEVDERGRLAIPRVDIAFDCGPQVVPDRIRSQLEGSVVMGLSLATLGEITFKNGRTEQDNFHTYPVTRMSEAPREIHVHLVPASDWAAPLGGVGEPGVPPIAPALCNAIFAATGKRIRQLPIGEQLAPGS